MMKLKRRRGIRRKAGLLLAAVALVMGMAQAGFVAQASGVIDRGWTLDAEGNLTISSDAGMTNWIANKRHYEYSVKSATISDGVTNIGKDGFIQCQRLTSVSIPDSVTSIGEYAFQDCTSLEQITIPAQVTEIGKYAFSKCTRLKECTIPAGITNVEEYMFWRCRALTSITIPEGVTKMGLNAFKDCTSLAEVIMLGETPPAIGKAGVVDETFAGCKFVTENKKGIHVPAGKAEAYKIAWADWKDYIAEDIASGTDWRLDAEGRLTISSDAGMTDWAAKKRDYNDSVKSVTISSGVTKIGEKAFIHCGSLEKITIPESVTSIGEYAFQNCTSLEQITIPAQVTEIGEYAFSKCTSLKEFTIPAGITNIEEDMFWGCSALTSITIPEGVTKIGLSAFSDCTSLAEVIMLGETPPAIGKAGVVDETFEGCKFVTENKKGICVPAGKEQAYKEAWTKWADYITADIASGTDWRLDAEGRLTISSDAGMADWIAKRQNYKDSVKSATISDGVTKIGEKAFWYCRSLTSVIIPDSVTSIGEDAFGTCSLTGIEIPAHVTEIGAGAFAGCKFTSITIPAGVRSISNGAFLMCEALTDITIPDSVTSIGEYAFQGCTSLKKITIPEQVTTIGENAFSECTSLKEFTIPEGITEINNLFWGCSALTSITIPEGVTKIGPVAFRGCISLAEVIMLGKTPPAIGEAGSEDRTFTGCKFVTDNKKGICVPAGKEQAYKEAWTKWADYITTDDAETAAEAKTATADKLKNITVTNATTKEEIQSAVKEALKSAGITGVTVTVENFTKTGATTSAEGSVSGTVKLTCGDETETVTIAKTIAKLPNTGNTDVENAKKVEAAKTAATTAVGNITVTNATTKEEIQNTVNEVLKSAGITGVTVTVENFQKTEATTSTEGSIRGTVKVTCGNQTATVTMDQMIAKLPQTGSTGSMTEEEKALVGKLAKELGVSEETAAKILAAAKELDVPMETLLIGENTLENHGSEGDVKGSTFQRLQAAASKTTSKSVKLTWNKVKGADGYQIYGAKCGKKNKLKPVMDIKKGSTRTYTQKKLKKGTAYKYIVRAYKTIDGKKITIAASKCVHAFTDGGKYGNVKSVKVKKSKVTLKKGKTYKLKASEVKAKKALKQHRKLCYESSNEKVASVTGKGVIRAKGKGTCTVYAYAQNGKQKKIKVTVK